MGYAGAMASTEAPPSGRHAAAQPRRAQPPAFPGCKPVRLSRSEIDRFEGRLEYWDAATETAWICEPTTPYHERPSRLVTRLAERIAGVRGSPIESYGSMDLLLRDAGGEPRRIMQADESVYLHPGRAKPGPAAMVVGEDDLSRPGAGGGSHHRRTPRQARAVRIVGDSRKCGWRCRKRRHRAVRTGAARG